MAEPVWIMVMFDLPVQTKEQRRSATAYRNLLRDLGFTNVQLSVYAKYLLNASGVRHLITPLKNHIPPKGEVRAIRLTDEQWASTYRWYGQSEVPMDSTPTQLMLFD